jgi:hypothetical protein
MINELQLTIIVQMPAAIHCEFCEMIEGSCIIYPRGYMQTGEAGKTIEERPHLATEHISLSV